MERSLIVVKVMTDKSSDKELILKFQNGQEHAFELLHSRYAGKLYTYLVYQEDRQVAEDLFQDIMIKVQKHLHRFDPGGNYRAWLVKIAVNHLYDHRRRKNRMRRLFIRRAGQSPEIEEGNKFSESDLADTIDVSREFMSREISEILKTAIQKLPEKQREVIHLHYLMDLTFREIAEALACSINTVSARARYALKNLKKILGPVLVDELKG
jgi:RNA polymerase sigma-70 factor (ECF subfamily)